MGRPNTAASLAGDHDDDDDDGAGAGAGAVAVAVGLESGRRVVGRMTVLNQTVLADSVRRTMLSIDIGRCQARPKHCYLLSWQRLAPASDAG